MDLAAHQSQGNVKIKDISQRQDISLKYLEQIITILSKAPAPDVNQTPGLAESANETVPFREPVQIGWQGVALATTVCGILAVAGFFVKKLRA